MSLLNINYYRQIEDFACGAACMQMVYAYHGLSVKQKDIYTKYACPDPKIPGQKFIKTDDLIKDAISRGFEAQWCKVPEEFKNETDIVIFLRNFIDKKSPIIVCQQFTKENRQIGHFRVLTGVDNKNIYLHDPHQVIGGKDKTFSVSDFISYWLPSGDHVIGWVYIEVKPKQHFSLNG